MPWKLRDYRCTECGTETELLLDSAEPPPTCCGAIMLPVLSVPALHSREHLLPGGKHARVILGGEAEVAARRGPDWRETPGSRRKAADEPERRYYHR